MTMLFAETEPTNLIPIGTVTGMLVVIFIAFLKDSARQDKRVDQTASALVAAAQQELQRAVAREKEAIEREHECQLRIEDVRRELRAENAELVARIQQLEALLWTTNPTSPAPPTAG